MLRTNLSTRPFYNERGVHVLIGVVAILLIALTAWNVYTVVTLSRANTELSSRVNQDHAEAEQLRKMATDIRRKINQDELQQVVVAAREANSLIDQRTFSWTAFFNRLESTMPPDVMLMSVRPSIKDGVTRVSMIVLGRRAEDIDEFIEKLEATGSFDDLLPSQTDYTDAGLRRVLVECVYRGDAPAEPVPEAAPAPPVTKPTTPPSQKGVTP